MIKNSKLFLWYSIVVFSLVTLLNCGPRLYDFSFELGNNRADGELAMLIKSKQGFHIPSNHIIAKTWATYHGPFKYPPNDLYTISWTNESGGEYSALVDLRTAVTKKFKGYLIFKIDDANNLICSASDSYKGIETFTKTIEGKEGAVGGFIRN
jgi:hypothetical protein